MKSFELHDSNLLDYFLGLVSGHNPPTGELLQDQAEVIRIHVIILEYSYTFLPWPSIFFSLVGFL